MIQQKNSLERKQAKVRVDHDRKAGDFQASKTTFRFTLALPVWRTVLHNQALKLNTTTHNTWLKKTPQTRQYW
ncbi:MAG: hypothetical protein ACK4FF_10000 [Limnobacter sp.]|uniref:hypothetical protein n=1 Tax=Limnobacter sp. TaxID=2003368 RepID=UPI00391DBFDB